MQQRIMQERAQKLKKTRFCNPTAFPCEDTHPKSIFSPGATLSTVNPADLTNSSTLSSPTKWPAPKAKTYPPS